MLTPQERQLLDRLLRRAHPTELQREVITRLQLKAGVPVEPGPAARAYRERVQRGRVQRIRELATIINHLAQPGPSQFPYTYRRIIEVLPRGGRHRRLQRFRTIRVDWPTPLSGPALEEAFRLAIIEFRRLVHYAGPIWYVTPQEAGQAAPDHYAPPLGVYDYEDD